MSSMNTLRPSTRGATMSVRDDISGKMVLNLDLNFPPLECWLAEGTSGSRHPWISITQIGDAIESQQGSTAPPSDRLNNSIIDLESIEDEVVTLASSRGFPQGRDSFRRSQPVIVVPDEDLGINYRRAEQRVARSSSNTRNKRARSSTSQTIINCDLYPDLEQDPIAKRKKSKPEPVVLTRKEPTFTCPVCLHALVDASSTICGHIFCLQCIKSSIQAQKKCPTCRRKLTMSSFHRVYFPATH
ncbi:hypothetical protein C4D60_Mb11t13410 [Musa balbisiana]|uniref:RING-type domain-containing protein n=1 Tax=Musa balbisiana TaxID=52838 RepID=A0A4S8J693_MUSBA|nr:hypothetical protein C4D60_Mb11t13410 [Musa balbisiana]